MPPTRSSHIHSDLHAVIEAPKTLTLRNSWLRPSESQIAALTGVPTGFVADALGGGNALHISIKPVGDGRDIECKVTGPALTADNSPGDILGTLAALSLIQAGDIVVASFGNHQGCASCGDRVLGMIKNSGGAGFVSDGPLRDYSGVVEVGLPAWCTGLHPGSPFTSGPATVGMPINIGGQQVCSGDMIVADQDGVVVVPFDQIDTVIERLVHIKQLEEELDNEVRDGLRIPPAITELLKSDDTRYIN